MMEEIIPENPEETQNEPEAIKEKENTQKPVRYYYAQLNAEGICCAVSDLSGQVEREDMIPLESYDLLVLGKKYQSGVWEEVENSLAEEPEIGATQDPQPSNAEIKTLLQTIQAQNQTLMEALAKMTGQPLESET